MVAVLCGMYMFVGVYPLLTFGSRRKTRKRSRKFFDQADITRRIRRRSSRTASVLKPDDGSIPKHDDSLPGLEVVDQEDELMMHGAVDSGDMVEDDPSGLLNGFSGIQDRVKDEGHVEDGDKNRGGSTGDEDRTGGTTSSSKDTTRLLEGEATAEHGDTTSPIEPSTPVPKNNKRKRKSEIEKLAITPPPVPTAPTSRAEMKVATRKRGVYLTSKHPQDSQMLDDKPASDTEHAATKKARKSVLTDSDFDNVSSSIEESEPSVMDSDEYIDSDLSPPATKKPRLQDRDVDKSK
jgi:hypothetical protein